MILYEPEGIPLPRVYARTLPYDVTASNTSFTLTHEKSWLRVYLMDPYHIHATIGGPPFPSEVIDTIAVSMHTLPYAEQVMGAIQQQEDFLRRNPGYRGVPVRESGKDPARRVMPATLEVGGQESERRTRRRKLPHEAQMGMFGEMQDEP